MQYWLLVYIVLSNSDGIDVGQVGAYETMIECFEARDELKIQVSGTDSDYFPINQQAICIKANVGF